jgi:glycosyltransferase involved in cell wall biosynthesis
MRVLLNALSTSGAKTGVGHYTAELIRCLRAQTSPGEIDCFPRGWVRQARSLWAGVRPWIERAAPPAPDQSTAGPDSRPAPRAGVLPYLRAWGQDLLRGHFRSLLRRGRYDLYHEPNFIPRPCDLRTAVTIYDLSVLHHPEWHPPERVADFEAHFAKGIKRCEHFFTISEFVRQEIISRLNVHPDRLTVAPCGVRPGLAPQPHAVVRDVLRRLRLPPRYFLHVGTLEPRKNVLTLLRAYGALPDSIRSAYPLLLVGGWGWKSAGVAEYLDRHGHRRGVRHLGYVADKYLATLYNGARALLFPTHYEGFGIPAVEMFACGGAVIASTAGALVEVAGRSAHFVDADDVDGWRDAMYRAAVDEEWWSALRNGVTEVAKAYTSERCAAETLRAYRRICGEHTGVAAAPRIAG